MEYIKQYLELVCLMWAIHSVLISVYSWVIKSIMFITIPKFLECSHCFTLWMVLACSLDVVMASVTSAGVYLFVTITNYIKSKTAIKL